jgi:hypothetical protein
VATKLGSGDPANEQLAVVAPEPMIPQPTVFPATTDSRPARPPPEFAVLGKLNVSVVVQVPSVAIVISNSAHVVFPSVFDFAEFTVNVAVPQDGDGVKVAQAVPVSPVPPFATETASTGRPDSECRPTAPARHTAEMRGRGLTY